MEHKMLTFREIRDLINEFSDSQLDMTATIHVSIDDEYFGITHHAITREDHDVLDNDHPYFVV